MPQVNAYGFDEPSIGEVIGNAAADIQRAMAEGRRSTKAINNRIFNSRRSYWRCKENCEDEYKEFRLSLLEKDILYAYVQTTNRMVPGGLQSHESLIMNMSVGQVDGGIIGNCAQLHHAWASCYTDKNRRPGDDYLTKCMPSYEPYEQCVMDYEYDHRIKTNNEYKDPISSIVAHLKQPNDTWSRTENNRLGDYFNYFDVDTIHKAAIIVWMAPGMVPRDARHVYEKYVYIRSEDKEKYGCTRITKLICWRQMMANIRDGKLTPASEQLFSRYTAEQPEGYKEGQARLQGIYDEVTKLYGKPKY
ncbi:hypothetical protein GCM10027217_34720 [Pseudomaricurvus hydrocarbonicus]